MKKMILLIALISLLMTTGCNQTLQINFVLPPILGPYLEWLIEFPGLISPETEAPPPTEILKRYNASQLKPGMSQI